MKILNIEDRFNPAMGYQTNYIAKFHNTSNEIIILSSFSQIIGQLYSTEELLKADNEFENQYNVKIIRLNSCFSIKGKYNIWLKKLKQTIKQINPDIIYVHGIESYTSMRLFSDKAFLLKYKFTGDTHTLKNQFQNKLKFKIYKWLFRKLVVRNINKFHIPIFYTADENKDILLNNYKINPTLIFPFEIGSDPEIFYKNDEIRLILRKELNIQLNDKVIIYTGKLNITKQPHLILQAIKLIEDKIDFNLHLLFIGTQDQKYFSSQIATVAFENKKIECVYFPNIKFTELYKYYSMADIAIFPKENTLSALECQLCGLPVIMENDHTNSLRLKRGGLLFSPNSISELSDKIYLLLLDSDLRHRLSIEGQKYVTEKYNYKKNVEDMIKTLENYYNISYNNL